MNSTRSRPRAGTMSASVVTAWPSISISVRWSTGLLSATAQTMGDAYQRQRVESAVLEQGTADGLTAVRRRFGRHGFVEGGLCRESVLHVDEQRVVELGIDGRKHRLERVRAVERGVTVVIAGEAQQVDEAPHDRLERRSWGASSTCCASPAITTVTPRSTARTRSRRCFRPSIPSSTTRCSSTCRTDSRHRPPSTKPWRPKRRRIAVRPSAVPCSSTALSTRWRWYASPIVWAVAERSPVDHRTEIEMDGHAVTTLADIVPARSRPRAGTMSASVVTAWPSISISVRWSTGLLSATAQTMGDAYQRQRVESAVLEQGTADGLTAIRRRFGRHGFVEAGLCRESVLHVDEQRVVELGIDGRKHRLERVRAVERGVTVVIAGEAQQVDEAPHDRLSRRSWGASSTCCASPAITTVTPRSTARTRSRRCFRPSIPSSTTRCSSTCRTASRRRPLSTKRWRPTRWRTAVRPSAVPC